MGTSHHRHLGLNTQRQGAAQMVAQKKAPQPPSCPPPTHLLTLPDPKKQALTTVVARPKKRPLATAKVKVEVDREAETKAKKATKAAEVRGLPKVSSLAQGVPSFSCNFRAPRALWAS